ncbi:hypothetical protein L9F63_000813, partial [Diploptera punctata]
DYSYFNKIKTEQVIKAEYQIDSTTSNVNDERNTILSITDDVLYQEQSSPDTEIFNVNFKRGRWDDQRLYKLFDFALAGDKFTEISNRSSNFHLAFSPEHPPVEGDFNFIINEDCEKPEEVLKELVRYRTRETSEWRNNALYPQNHLRNQARKNCQSSYVFLTDIDIIPSYAMAEEIDVFLKTVPCEKLCAYVIPVYEIDDSVRFPENKSVLVKYAKSGLARPFHERIYKAAQMPTDYKRWEENVDDENKTVHISHTVAKYKEWYEPFFIVLDTAPPYDERFIGYGYTRNTQVYEMNAAGYEFKVLSSVFACHWHFKTFEQDYYSWRTVQLKSNHKQINKFKNEIIA